MKNRLPNLLLGIHFGLLIVFSGFVKAVDPLGFAYKIQDYINAMLGSEYAEYYWLALASSVLLAAIEFVVGVNMVFGAKLKQTIWVAILLMLYMTPLTLWIALENPVHDCGCFGDALVISNWATFWKNIVIDAVLVGIILLQKSYKSFLINRTQWFVSIFAFLFSIGVSWYGYAHLPLLDFRPYKTGSNIIKGMEYPDDAQEEIIETYFTYAKNGKEAVFVLDSLEYVNDKYYPYGDTTWLFTSQETEVIQKGYEPPIHDFSITLPDEGDITDIVLAEPGYTFLLVAYDFQLSDVSKSKELNDIYEYAKENQYGFYCMSASTDSAKSDYLEQSNAAYPIADTDKITLKTMIRSNPGLILIKDAVVINKWHVNDLPNFNKKLEDSNLGILEPPSTIMTLLWPFLIFILPLFFLMVLDKQARNKID